MHWAAGSKDLSLSFFSEAEALRNHEMQRVLAVGSEKERAACARELQSDLDKVVSYCLASDGWPSRVAAFAAQLLLRRKGCVLDAIAHTMTHVREGARAEDQILIARLQVVREEIASLLAPVLVSRRPTDEGDRLRRLRAEEEQLEASLSYRGALYRPVIDTVTLKQVQERLEPHDALVELLRFDEFDPKRTGKKGPWKDARYAAMVLRRSGDPQWINLGPAAPIEVQTDRWRSMLRNVNSDIRELQALGAELYGVLVEPLHAAIQGARRLLISPHGRLALIPFGALRSAGDRYLKEQFRVSYLSTGRDLVRSTGDEPQARGIIVVAAPDFEFDTADPISPAGAQLSEGGEFEPLPETKKEANEISRLFEDVMVISGRDATSQRLREVSRPIILHVATHGIFCELRNEEIRRRSDLMSIGEVFAIVESVSRSEMANPMFGSGLVLAGANHPGQGVLSAQEIAGLDLRGTALAVLSACETGLGTVKAGEEFAGLRRALAIAGSQTQVTSLWRVDDAATCSLMAEYYQLLSAGEGRADALEFAQARLVEAHPEWRHPAYWAAFISAGAYDAIANPISLRSETARQSGDDDTNLNGSCPEAAAREASDG